jgi:vancomycin resistance protein YoaR
MTHASAFRRVGFVLLGAALLLLAAVLYFAADPARVVPGVRAAGIDVGGVDAAALRVRLSAAAAGFSSQVVVVASSERTWLATHDEIGVAFDTETAVADALAVAHTGSPFDRLSDIARAASGGTDVGWPRRVADRSRFEAFISEVTSEVDRAPTDGAVTITTEGVAATLPRVGERADRQGLETALLAARSERTSTVMNVEIIPPEIDEAAMSEALERAEAAFAPLTLKAGSESLTVSAARIAGTMRVTRADSDGSPILLTTVDEGAMAALLDEVADALDGPPRSAVLEPGGDRLAVVPGRDGVRIDRDASLPIITNAVFDERAADRSVVLTGDIEAPALTTADAQHFADSVHLIGGFTTYFPVNQARATNIGLAAARFDGMVIGPGESFSFWGRIGEVSARTGYVSAGAIVGGVSSTAIGGGLCQVSTTFFNAVARAGMRIDERHPHSYYIERYPVGMDAAVFAPSVDFRWTNDGTEPVYLRAAGDDTSVSFWLYGADTHRSTVLPPPVQANFRYPYAGQPADPAHAPGYVVLGRDAWATRIVLVDGVEVSRDVWYSHYAPVWGGPAR